MVAPDANDLEGRLILGWVVVLAALLLAGPAGAVDRLPVVASFSVIADMLANVGGDRIDIKTIVGPGGDCELYQPTAADVGTIAAARAVFINDLNEEFEPWLEPLLKQAGFTGTKVVVSRNVRTLTAEEEHPISGRQLPTAIDQHAWLDPRNGAVYVRNIAAALVRLDPADAAEYRAQAAVYTKEIQGVDDWARKEIDSVPADKRRALASHDSLQYIANAYGITLLAINGWTNKSEPSAAELAKLAQQIRASRVKALFLDSITDPRAVERIAGETGAVIGGTLYGDALSPKGGEADSYVKMLRHDLSTLKAGMLAN
jgi:zinc/manganese transport system substrate-binding protein